MNKRNDGFTHMEYRGAKVIHLVEKNNIERFIYNKQEISREEADAITSRYLEERAVRKLKKEESL